MTRWHIFCLFALIAILGAVMMGLMTIAFIAFLIMYIQILWRVKHDKENYLVYRLLVTALAIPVSALVAYRLYNAEIPHEMWMPWTAFVPVICLIGVFLHSVISLLALPLKSSDGTDQKMSR